MNATRVGPKCCLTGSDAGGLDCSYQLPDTDAASPLGIERVRLHLIVEQGLIDGRAFSDRLHERTNIGSELVTQNLRGDGTLRVGDGRTLRVERPKSAPECFERDWCGRAFKKIGCPRGVAAFEIAGQSFIEPCRNSTGRGARDERVHKFMGVDPRALE